MEAEKRVGEIDWSWAVARINRAINEHLTAIEKDATLDSGAKKVKVYEIEKAWQRILRG